MAIAFSSGRCEPKSGVPFRSENDCSHVLQKTMRIRLPFPLQDPQRRFPIPRFPWSGQEEFWQQNPDRSLMVCPRGHNSDPSKHLLPIYFIVTFPQDLSKIFAVL